MSEALEDMATISARARGGPGGRADGRRHRTAVVGVVVAAALTATACGGGAAPAPGGSASKTPAQSTTKAPGGTSTGATAGASATTGGIPSIPAGQTVNITTAWGVPSAVFAPIWIAYDKGYFKKFGLNVKLEAVEGATQVTAIVAGSIPIGNVGGAEVLDARSKGAPVIALLEGTHYAVFELHGSPKYKTVSAFKNQTIAITKTGSSTDMAARVLLAKNGLTPGKNVKLLSTANMPAIFAVLTKGIVQGGVMSPPTTVRADKAGFPMVESTLQAKVPLQQNLLATTATYAKAHPAVVYAYMKAYLQGLADFFQKPSEAIAEIAKYTKTTPAIAKAAYEAVAPAMVKVPLVSNDGLRTVQKYGANKATRSLNVAQAHDDSFLKALIASGYLKKIGLQ